jgi:hypothetical protein
MDTEAYKTMRLVAEYDPNWIDEDDCDDIVLEMNWEMFEGDVNYAFDKVFPKGEVGMIAKNHGWRKLNGHRPVEHYENGIDAVRKAMVNGAHAVVYIHTNAEYGRHIAINTAHHDSPTGDEWTYLVRPARFKEVA